MPAAWSAKDERQYKHIVKSCRKRGRSAKGCKRMAAATVNKTRKRQGRTLSGVHDDEFPWMPFLVITGIGIGLVAWFNATPRRS